MILARDSRGEIGLSRLVLIQSGVCDYFEIEPERSTHLAGENGLGKTSILNSLQFLVIDDWNNMKFPKDRVRTENHYFPEEVSSIVFEIQTFEGSNSMIVFRGMGPASTNRYSRYCIDGQYEREIFLDGNQPRSWQDVCIVASEQGREIADFTNPKKLRSYLRTKLKWLPTKDENQIHSDFVQLLKTLNSLGSVKDRDLKEILMNINHGIQRSLDFRTEYGDEWQRHLRRRKQIVAFEQNSSSINRLQEFTSEMGGIEEKLTPQIDLIGPAIEFHNANSSKVQKEIQDKIKELSKDITSFNKGLNESQEKMKELEREIYVDENDVSKLLKESSWVENNSIEERRNSLSETLNRHTELNTVIKRSEKTHYTVEYIEREISKKRDELGRYRSIIDGNKGTILDSLSKEKIPHERDAMKLFNDGLISAQGSIAKPEDFASLLEEIENGIKKSKLNFRGLVVDDIDHLISTSTQDPSILEEKCTILDEEITNLQNDLEISKNLDSSKRELQNINEEISKLNREISRIEDWKERGSKELPQLQSGLKNKARKKKDCDEEISILNSKIKDKQFELVEKNDILASHENKLDEINVKWSQIQNENSSTNAYRAKENFQFEDLGGVLSDCEKKMSRLTKLRGKATKIQLDLYRNLSDLIPNSSFEDFNEIILKINSEIDDQRENARKEWMNLISNIGRSASLMKDGLRTIKQEISDINRLCGKTQFSNLEEFYVDFREQSTDIDLMSDLTGFSTYTNDPATLDAIENLGEKCMHKQSIELGELFSLEFKIGKKGSSKPEIVRSLDDAGSTGTIVLIKAVLLMILLYKRTQWKKNRPPIPFFLDEVGVFGSNNKGQIVEVGKDLNFQLFTASPESIEESDVVYAILGDGEKDRIYVDPKHKRPKPNRISGEEE